MNTVGIEHAVTDFAKPPFSQAFPCAFLEALAGRGVKRLCMGRDIDETNE
jgi:hypothetical protein